jgi:NADPH-dependent 2,4-dienoyl-CoA reductase/sulfur reductase-like enzyme
MKRRSVLVGALATPFVGTAGRAQGTGRVVVVGGGFAGATAARRLARAGHQVTMIEAGANYTCCPFSNEVIAGLREMEGQTFGWDKVAASGVTLVSAHAASVDSAQKKVLLDSAAIPYDRLVLAPGVDLLLAPEVGSIPGYDQAATAAMPHAWKAGIQTVLLREQLRAMPDGGMVVMSVPANPYRCPPGPYERASLIGWYLKTNKPRSKLLILDAKDAFSKQKLFEQAWATLYKGIIERVSLSDGGAVTRVDAAAMTVSTDFDTHKANVANIIPPQRAGSIALAAGVADKTGWCPVDPVTFESKRIAGIHVLGDAAIMGAMPKSAFAANAQAKVCANAIIAILAGQTPQQPKLINTCYSLAAPDFGFSVAGVYRPLSGQLTEVEGSGGPSPLDASPDVRKQEAAYADVWYKTITGAVFG